jgi:hypothetical protein
MGSSTSALDLVAFSSKHDLVTLGCGIRNRA